MERDTARRYVIEHLRSSRELRLRLSDLFLDKTSDMDPEYLVSVMKSQWSTLEPTKQLALAQAIAGARHYEAFMASMTG